MDDLTLPMTEINSFESRSALAADISFSKHIIIPPLRVTEGDIAVGSVCLYVRLSVTYLVDRQ